MRLKRTALRSSARSATRNTALGTNYAKTKQALMEAEAQAQSQRSFQSTSALGGTTGAAGANIQTGSVDLGIDMSPLMENMTLDHNDNALFDLYRDIYYHDAVCGSAVDMYSTLPFSEFSIGGADEKTLAPYREAIERLNLRTAMPGMTVDYLVTGAYIGSILHSKKQKKVVDLMNHRRDHAEIHPLPFYSQDPVIRVKVPEDVRRTMNIDSPRIKALRGRLGDEFISQFDKGQIELDPMGSIYLPRQTFSFGQGVSWFRRVVPIYLIEKNLFRGTLVESQKRQRGIMHCQMGDGDQWVPDNQEMEFMTDLLHNADLDPLGAVITTRLGVAIDEFRQGGDFWKVTDLWDQTATFKLRALSISEAFLSGDASYANMEGSLQVLIESMRAFRDHMTRGIFYNKVFPLVSMMQGNAVNKNGKLIKRDGLMEGGLEDRLSRMQDGSRLFIPSVHWEKQLAPDADQQRMDLLRSLTEMGVPVPLRAIAAAGGFNLDNLLQNQTEDFAMQTKILQYNARLKELQKEYGGGEDDMGGGFGSYSNVLDERGQPGLGGRDFGGSGEIIGQTRTGKPKYIHNQKKANADANENIFKAMASLSKNKRLPLRNRTCTTYVQSAKDGQLLKKMQG